MARQCSPDWLTAYMNYTCGNEAPDAFHFWTGLTLVSTMLKRQVWKDRRFYTTWPNIYVFLVGPVGVRKSTPIGIGQMILEQCQHKPYIISGSRSPEALISELASRVTINYTNPAKTPFIVIADEAPTFFKNAKYTADLVPMLNKWYDCRTDNQGTIARGMELVENPYPTMICGVVPEILALKMPKDVIVGGFSSRIIWVYSDDVSKCVAHPELMPLSDPDLEAKLVHDLNEIAMLSGEIRLTNAAVQQYIDWYQQLRVTIGKEIDFQLAGYLNRKGEQCYKVAILLSVTEGDSLVVEARHFEFAAKLLDDLQPNLTRVYGATARAEPLSDRDIVLKIIQRHGNAITRSKLTHACCNHNINVERMEKALEQLGAEKLIECVLAGASRVYQLVAIP